MNTTWADQYHLLEYVHVMKDGPVTNEIETQPSKHGS